MTAFRRFAVLLPALFLGACAAPGLSSPTAASIHRVGVVSQLPQSLAYQKLGLTPVHNESRVLPVAGDVFNTRAREAVEQRLRRSGRFEVKQLAVSGTATLADLARANGVDAVVVVSENVDSRRGIASLSMLLRAGVNDIRAASALAGVQVTGVMADGTVLLRQQADPYPGMVVLRPDGQPWAYRLEENLDEGTQQAVVRALLPGITAAVDSALGDAGL